ncbi:MAG: permease [Thermodesulfobacteriaceae bacterium]|nr:permease [Thermodesulfobacteriaceae bacterium]MCX8042375.1 permease [Thermodesulfobacteriaceae bacterium]
MNLKKELKPILLGLFLFLFLYFFPKPDRVLSGIREGVLLLHWYIKEHTIFCLIPAFYIAGAIGTFLSKESILKYLGPEAPKIHAYLIASVAGTVLAVCSCTVLPLFAGLYLQGAGIGPATTFLYSGPAINVLAIVLTTKILGTKIGFFRAVGAISMSLIIGLLMHFIFKKREKARLANIPITSSYIQGPPLKISTTFLATLIGILILVTWEGREGISEVIYNSKWILTSFLVFFLFLELIFFFKINFWYLGILGILVSFIQLLIQNKEISFLVGTLGISYLAYQRGGITREWFENTYILARQIFPFLFLGIFISGFLFGFKSEGLIPPFYIEILLGGEDFFTHLLASFISALMYFATITEVPIIQGLKNAGMNWGPALSMLLAGPAVSLPSLLALKKIMGEVKTLAFLFLTVLFSALFGYFYQIFIIN